MPRFPFDFVFNKNADGSISPKQTIKVGGFEITAGTILKPQMILGGVDLTQFIDKDFEIETQGDILVIKGVYGDTISTIPQQ